MKQMRLTAGLNAAEDYPEYVKAGADEVFAGFVPEEWQLRYGLSAPLNRREVCLTRVQLGTEDELRLLRSLREEYGAPVSITMNGLCYDEAQYPLIRNTLECCLKLGFDRFILADPALMCYLHETGMTASMELQVSGELGAMSAPLLRELKRWGAKRIIFHRKVSVGEMAVLTAAGGNGLEYEAFLMNEDCRFHGGYCNSLHCDALPPLCRVPCRSGRADGRDLPPEYDAREADMEDPADTEDTAEALPPGAGGCGLCALPALEQAGITHLKIVGRGAFREDMLRDLSAARRALELLKQAENGEEYPTVMLREIFPKTCGKHCYYRRI